MPRGRKNGTNPNTARPNNGRPKGALNKATTERIHQERIEAEARRSGVIAGSRLRPLAKSVIEDFLFAFVNIAAPFQNRIAEARNANREPSQSDLDAFEKWGRLVVEAGDRLASYQSPKLKAIAVAMPPAEVPMKVIDGGKVLNMADPSETMRIYQERIKSAVG